MATYDPRRRTLLDLLGQTAPGYQFFPNYNYNPYLLYGGMYPGMHLFGTPVSKALVTNAPVPDSPISPPLVAQGRKPGHLYGTPPPPPRY